MVADDPSTASDRALRRRALAAEWTALLDEIRERPGFRDFMRPTGLTGLLSSAADGPVVMLNASRWTCDALVLTADGLRPVPLPGLSFDDALTHTDRYLRAVQELDILAARAASGAPADLERYWIARVAVEQVMIDTQEWVWHTIADPVLDALGFTGPPDEGRPWPRLWWCPSGPLTSLPLHSAGYHEDAGRSRPSTVIDRVVSSYTPTLKALSEARRPRPSGHERPVEDKLLLVTVANAPGQPPLPAVAREQALLQELFTGRHTLLADETATVEAVRAGMATHRWTHFSCHGTQDLETPSNGGVFLADGKLTISEISRGRHHGDFAFLSACKTATGSVTLPDEVITLAAALHYTGFRNVVATTWSVTDAVAADLAEAVYRRMVREGRFFPDEAASALHEAVRELRDRGENRHHPSVWSRFTHTGP
ncbi:CHAT domain-containing protein [Streptomyces sp. NPDC050546]|uniref:CHAT domain-containing protein n=1 Tax=Streptomyces sp. NPDC050546 TaxID=3365628 RepID=UPI0037982671